MKSKKLGNYVLKATEVFLLFFFFTSCTASAEDHLNITSPSPNANFQLDANQNPPVVTFTATLYTECLNFAPFHWTGVLNYNYIDENGQTQNKEVYFQEDTAADMSGWYTNTTWTPRLQDIKMTGGTMNVVVTTYYGTVLYTDTRTITFESDNYQIDVTPSTNWIALHDTEGSKDGGSDKFSLPATDETPATIDIKVTKSGKPVQNTQVKIRAINVPGSGDHPHDSNRDPYSQSNRPMANLEVVKGILVDGSHNDITATTDSSGMIRIKYTPPYVIVGKQLKRVVAGTDTITSSLVDHPNIKKEIQIGVGYIGFVKFSDDNVDLQKQDFHAMEYYCTANTMTSIKKIAKKFKEETGENLPISAMSVQYGGLLDWHGNWNAPHVTHSNGKCVDIPVRNMVPKNKQKFLSMVYLNHYEDTNFKRLVVEKDKNDVSYCYHLSFNT